MKYYVFKIENMRCSEKIGLPRKKPSQNKGENQQQTKTTCGVASGN